MPLQRLLELVVAVDADRALGAGARARLEDERVALALGEGARLGGRVDGGAGSRGHPGLAQRLLHRRLVAAQPRRAHARAGDAAHLAHLRCRHRVRLDGRLERVDPDLVLEVADRLDHLVDVRHRPDAVVAAQRAEHVVAEVGLVGLADAVDVRPHRGERVHEATLVRRERRLHEDDVHLADAIGPPEGSPRLPYAVARVAPETPARGWPSEDEDGGVASRASPHPQEEAMSSTVPNPASPATSSSGWSGALVALGILSIVLGVVVLVWPEATLLVVAITFGLQLIAAGAVRLSVSRDLPERAGLAQAGLDGARRALDRRRCDLPLPAQRLALRHRDLHRDRLDRRGHRGPGPGVRLGPHDRDPRLPHRPAASCRSSPASSWRSSRGSSLVLLARLAGIMLILIGIAEIVTAFMARRAAGTGSTGSRPAPAAA